MLSMAAASLVGAPIANEYGVPGSVGLVARTSHEGRAAVVASQHVLFGTEARARGPVWLLDDAGQRARSIGSTRCGRRGTVRHRDAPVFVDCALVELADDFASGSGWQLVDDDAPAPTRPARGDRVTKIGAATGTTEGIVVDVGCAELALIAGRPQPAPGQLRIRALGRQRAFSRPGDSGAVVRNEEGAAVGLLWGVAPDGSSVACPIGPVLWVLHATPARLVPTAASSRAGGVR